MELNIVNPDPRYSPVNLIEPTTLGYIHLAAEVKPRPMPPQRLPFVPNGREKTELLSRLKMLANSLEQLELVEKATVFAAVAIPPTSRFSSYLKERADSIHLARFDVIVLIETASPQLAREVQQTPDYRALLDALESEAKDMHVMVARNAKRIGDVEKTRDGLFLFNYFVADDANVALELWDYLAGWYEAETGLDNSTLLVPLELHAGQPGGQPRRSDADPVPARRRSSSNRWRGAAPDAPGGCGGWVGSRCCPEQDAPEEI
jgi:hypothetical protein